MTRAAQKQLKESKHHVTGTKEVLAVAPALLRTYKGDHSAMVKEYTWIVPVQKPKGEEEPTWQVP